MLKSMKPLFHIIVAMAAITDKNHDNFSAIKGTETQRRNYSIATVISERLTQE